MYDRELYTMAQVAEIFQCKRGLVDQYRKTGLLKCMKLGSYKVRAEEVKRFLEWAEGKDISDPSHIQDI